MLFFVLYILIGLLFLQISLTKNMITKGFSTSARISQMTKELVQSLGSLLESLIHIFFAIINIVQTLVYFLLWPIGYLYIQHVVSKIKKQG